MLSFPGSFSYFTNVPHECVHGSSPSSRNALVGFGISEEVVEEDGPVVVGWCERMETCAEIASLHYQ